MNQKTKTLSISALVLTAALVISACSPLSVLAGSTANLAQPANKAVAAQPQAATPAPTSPAATSSPAGNSLVAAYEGALNAVYEKVNPSVVTIEVMTGTQGNLSGSQGSGFVWDQEGHIVTNNHVIDGANSIQVTFFDGTSYPATLVGNDADSDLAVVKIDAPVNMLHPIEVADSTQVRIGDLAIAIGNPFGLSNTMTVGIISALGRTLSGSDGTTTGSGYSNPDIIQTDAPINPGNSGGVLVNENGQLVGVTNSIESPVRANAGVGFAIPSATVNRVVPILIDKGTYSYAWMGISGSSLVPQLATAMKLDANQRGVLVGDVTAGGPAEKAGLRASTQATTINGFDAKIGGDVITAIDGKTVVTMDDLITYLNANTVPDQQVTLSILRDGSSNEVKVTLGTRPASTQQVTQNSNPSQPQSPQASPSAFIGFSGVALNEEINKELDLSADTQGILVQRIETGSPAEKAGMQAGSRPVLIGGHMVLLGGDVIQSINSQAVTSVGDLRTQLSQFQAGDKIAVDVLRDGKTLTLEVTLASRPAQ
jgi:serine protease Do